MRFKTDVWIRPDLRTGTEFKREKEKKKNGCVY